MGVIVETLCVGVIVVIGGCLLQFVPGTHLLFSCSKDTTLKFWDGDSFEHVTTLEVCIVICFSQSLSFFVFVSVSFCLSAFFLLSLSLRSPLYMFDYMYMYVC